MLSKYGSSLFIYGVDANRSVKCSQCVAKNNRVSFYVFLVLIFILEVMLFDFKASFMSTHFWPMRLVYKLISPILNKL